MEITTCRELKLINN